MTPGQAPLELDGEPARARLPAFWVAALATLLVRALVTLSRLDELELELYSGSLAWSLLQGMPLDPHQLPVIPHNRGSVVFGALLAPAFWAFGPRLWVIKLLALALSAVTAGLCAWLAERHVSRAAGLVAALLLALLPPNYQMVDVLALASHGDSVLFTALALALLLAHRGETGPLDPGRALAFGLVTGFGCFFSLQCLVALPALAVVWWLRDRSFWRRPSSLLAVAAAAVWLLPARAMLGAGDGGVIVNQSASERLLPDGPVGAASKWLGTFTRELPDAWLFELHGGAIGRWLLLVGLGIGLVLTLRRALRLRPLAVFCLLYPALVAAAYAVSNFQMKLDENLDGMGSRYLMPMQPFMALWIPMGFERGVRAAGALAAAAAALAGLLGLASLLDPGLALRQPPVRGTELAFFHGHVEYAAALKDSDGDGWAQLETRVGYLERVEPDWAEWRPLVYRAIVPPGAATLETRVVDALPSEVRPYYWVALGRAQVDGEVELPALLALEPEARRWALRGMGAQLMSRLVAESARARGKAGRFFEGLDRVLADLPAGDRAAVLEGLGYHLGLRLTPYQPILLSVLQGSAAVPAAHRERFFRGVGEGYRQRFAEDGWREPGELSLEPLLPAGARAPVRAGLLSVGEDR